MTRRWWPPRAERSSRDWRSIAHVLLTAAAIAAVIGAVYNFVVLPLAGSFAGPFEDFSAYAGAAHAVAAGTSPYAAFGGATIVMTGFDYPPFAAVMLRPLAFLSARWQELVWLWISLAALVGGAVITARALLPASWPRARIGIFVALTFPAATYNLWHGQMNTVIFLLLAIALSDYLAGHRTRCGVALGLAAGIKIAPIVLLIVLLRRGWWRGAIAGAAAGAATLAVGVGALGWPVTRQYLTSVLPVLNRDNGWIYNQTWNGVVNRLALHSVLTVDSPSFWLHAATTVLSLATVGVLLVAVRRRERTRAERGAEFACGVTVMLLVGTIAWYPVYVHLLIAIAAAAGLAHERGRLGRALYGWSAAALIGVGVVGGAAIAAIGAAGISPGASGLRWWLFLQACSLPAALAVGLLVVLVSALRSRDRATLRVAAPAR
ncbi:MAG TPA: glycosyltransferase family 87 protein [Candidatus Deferrimicrobium sp.]|nr:glycosyltransferase family 87 protein [Candidatus Deferrimicrobium sp.]